MYVSMTKDEKRKYNASYRAKNKDRVRKYRKEYYAKNKDSTEHREYCAAAWRKHKNKLKQKVFDHYGWVCACCGETTPEFLTIDHVNNDGNKHRDRIGYGVRALYSDIIRSGFCNKFQILCMNCNFGKSMNGGKCPHSKRKQNK